LFAEAAEPLSPSIRIVSYNVRKGTPAKAIAADLLPLKADIIALQETDSGTRRSRGEDQPHLLRELLGMNGHYRHRTAWTAARRG
jgi:endonuclease/exonuclease/phosphatase family metal-dependent hydrolase